MILEKKEAKLTLCNLAISISEITEIVATKPVFTTKLTNHFSHVQWPSYRPFFILGCLQNNFVSKKILQYKAIQYYF